MHLAACRFFMHLTALMHLQISIKYASSYILFFLHILYMLGISLRIIVKGYIIRNTIINETSLDSGFNWVCNCKPKAAI